MFFYIQNKSWIKTCWCWDDVILLSQQRALNQFTCWGTVFQIITSCQNNGMSCYLLEMFYLFNCLVKTHKPFLAFQYLNSNNIITHAVNVIVCPQVGWCWTHLTLVPWATTTPWSMRWATSWDCTMYSRGSASGTPVMIHVR